VCIRLYLVRLAHKSGVQFAVLLADLLEVYSAFESVDSGGPLVSFIKALPLEERMGFEALKAVLRAGLPCAESFQRMEHSELGDEVLGVLVQALWQDVVAAEDLVLQFELILAMEKRVAGQALEDDSTEAPKVRAEGRDLVHQHLG